jgi:demethylmenaquinone methyltransferase/2-methoxy-6-polyprenyl-1,4-benzoquinol methylase
MFSRIASRYDLLNHLLSLNIDRTWRRTLVRSAKLAPGGRVLDACTGTADVAMAFVERRADCEVFGIDLSSDMLRVGKNKINGRRLNGRITLLESDVLALPFADEVFDVVSIAFGLRNLPDYAEGIVEMTRVLRRGGRLMILEFSPPERQLYLKGYDFYLRRVVPFVGGLVSGSRQAYRYLASSIGDFVSGPQIFQMMNSAGLHGLQAKKLTGGIAYLYEGEK